MFADYWEMTKPSITLLVLVTTAGAMVWAAGGLPPLGLTVATLVGLACASGGGAVLNHVFDRDIDRLMERTRNRPVATGRVSVAAATAFGLALNVIAAVVLLTFTNVLTAVLAIGGSAFYVVVYTMVLKRRTPQNIVIGGAAGAIPPLAGWAAVTGEIGLAPLIMFLIIFLWTPPHFWALAILKKDEYARAGVPMLPAVATERETAVQILVVHRDPGRRVADPGLHGPAGRALRRRGDRARRPLHPARLPAAAHALAARRPRHVPLLAAATWRCCSPPWAPTAPSPLSDRPLAQRLDERLRLAPRGPRAAA